MGDIIGGLFGGIGSVVGAGIQANAAEKALNQALTGYNYLTTGAGKPIISGAVTGGEKAGNMFRQLVGIDPITAETGNAFNKYLDSTGYKFQLGEGQDAVTSAMSQKGLRNSGATAKALTKYGQNLASTTFNNFLNTLGSTQQTGLNAATTVGNAGTGAGSAAAEYAMTGGNAWAQGVAGGLGGLSNMITNWN